VVRADPNGHPHAPPTRPGGVTRRDLQPLLHAWTNTDMIMAYMVGKDNDVNEITEAAARKLKPKAFSNRSG